MFPRPYSTDNTCRSRPTRARGLKFGTCAVGRVKVSVAPYTGAWIEMAFALRRLLETLKVAPYTGAWIEILRQAPPLPPPASSRPTRARGLKFPMNQKTLKAMSVAPYTGAWIEMAVSTKNPAKSTSSRPTRARGLKLRPYAYQNSAIMSRPTRARGLKSHAGAFSAVHTASRPTRARGLKFFQHCGAMIQVCVAPYTGAWIEIPNEKEPRCEAPWSRPTRARGLKSPQ